MGDGKRGIKGGEAMSIVGIHRAIHRVDSSQPFATTALTRSSARQCPEPISTSKTFFHIPFRAVALGSEHPRHSMDAFKC